MLSTGLERLQQYRRLEDSCMFSVQGSDVQVRGGGQGNLPWAHQHIIQIMVVKKPCFEDRLEGYGPTYSSHPRAGRPIHGVDSEIMVESVRYA
jgi:hypothetical protein